MAFLGAIGKGGKGHDQSKTNTTTTDRDDIAAQITGGSGDGYLQSVIAGQGAAVGTGAAPAISLQQSTLGIGFGETVSNTYLTMHDAGAIQGGLTLANNAMFAGFDLLGDFQRSNAAMASEMTSVAAKAVADNAKTTAAEFQENLWTMGLLLLAGIGIWAWGMRS